MNSEPDYQIFFFVIFMGVWMSTLIYSPILTYLRKPKVFYSLLILSIIGIIYACFQIKVGWEHRRIIGILSPLLLFIFLLLYKIANLIALKKYNRPMYFSCRISTYLKLKEAEESTWLEWMMQAAITLGATLLWNVVVELVEDWVRI
ncbi:hypothetical protein [Myroides odoratus]|uniref:Uncharacterized protein n=1 Tax=Myroides odoratus TaxID=256 RepID=A0A9Q6ZHB5_MYROD|nr:hypothetical protein [Myroides odoratus]EHQ42934.1 hypothetical protein Myrod_2107 [Myroides odoratus DSM 2801]EKB07515.1 hypothetical protein HMPREF9716_01965 [Myroides odoratus CIP 103059]QQU00284.1 hypothetical protein I6I88_00475 [Myroides odoratus]WQD57488.1 hypothetical protein U0010_18560 [Myroides odoratus]STZ30202.1 Uncharacterised protein [Myroides odoratus]